MNAFQFGQFVSLTLDKQAAAPSAYPALDKRMAADPAYTPRTPPETFRGVQVEANIPPRIFSGATENPSADVFPDIDNLRGVTARQQIGQNTPLPQSAMQWAQYNKQTGSNERQPFVIPPKIPPRGTGMSQMKIPPRGTGAGQLKK